MSSCPFCAEEVEAAAQRCRHCGESLGRPAPGPEAPPLPKALLLLGVGLLALAGLRTLGFMELYMLSRVGMGIGGAHQIQGVLAALAAGAGTGLVLRWRIGRTLALASAGLALVTVAVVVVGLSRGQGGTSYFQSAVVMLSLPFELLALLATGLLARRDVRAVLESPTG